MESKEERKRTSPYESIFAKETCVHSYTCVCERTHVCKSVYVCVEAHVCESACVQGSAQNRASVTKLWIKVKALPLMSASVCVCESACV